MAQSPSALVPAPAQRYLDILLKRPQPGTIFERFYAAWLEESSATELGVFLEARTKLPAATAADQLLLAVFHSHRGDDRAALAAYEAALKLDPTNAAAWIERSRLEARALDFAAALQSLDEAVKAKPDAGGTMEIGKLRGRALLRLGKNEEALRTWKELAAAHAEDEDLSEELIDLLTDEGQYEAALEAAQALIKRSPDPVARTLRQLRLTDILLLAERRDEALNTLREALAATGSDSWVEGDVLGRISRVFRMSDDVEGFEKFMADLVKEHPQRVALAWQHTQLLGEVGKKDDALKEARALLQSNPGRRDLQEGFLDLLESLDLIKEAVEQAQALTQQNAADKEMLVRLASLQHRAKEDAAAQSTLERFLKLPGIGEPDHLRAARLLENWEDPPAKPGSPAAQAYARLVESFPASISAQEAQAHYLHRAGQRDAALAIWTRLAKSATLEDLLRITQALQARQESRTALDLLAPREQDFAQEPRFYALLVQLGIANKEVERALPWARTRLRLAQDAESIETAVKDILLVLRSDESGKLSTPMLQELQSQAAPSIQSRCLLAALLETAGKNADAEKTLTSAPAEDKLISLSQLSVLFQNRQEWEKAAQALQQVIALPGARTTARVQRMVDFYRRAEKPELSLTWIAEWKKLSPSAVPPWLDESRLLISLNRTKDALALLRGALRKFPDSIEAASSYATLCLENGQPDEAERTYLALYEKTTDATARLRLISPLALAAQQHNSLPRLIENFHQRQKQNRASAQPWLALAEIYRSTNNDEERRRCLYEASRLRPQDLSLLLDIARGEEEVGLTAEALRTLESAAKLDKTSKTRENIARLQIESGDADLGYRMLFEIAGGSQMDARALEQMADTIAEKGEWERVITFLEPVLEKHPKDYRLHYLNAVALEEAGREKEAVRAFIEIMSMHEELPGVLSTGRSIGLRRQYDSMSLPPGTEDWLVLPSMVQAAYIHRQKQGGRGSYGGYNPFGSPPASGLPANGFVQQAPGVTESPVLALAHVLQLVSMWDVAEREPALRSLKQAGVSDAPLLLTAAENSPQLVITPEMLVAEPQNTALHAAWLMQSNSGDPAELLPLWENAFKLFQTTHPALALRTAAMAWHSAGDQPPAWVRRILDISRSLPKADISVMQTLIGMLRVQSDWFPRQARDTDAAKLSPEDVRAITATLSRWMNSVDEEQSYQTAEVIHAFAAVKDWNGLIEIIKHQLSLPDKPQAQTPAVTVPMMAGRGYYRNFQPTPMPMNAIAFKLPANALNWVSNLTAQPNSENMELSEEAVKWRKEVKEGLTPFIEKSGDARLKLILRLMTGDLQAMLDELTPRLSASPALEDLLLAGWLSQQLNQPEKALSFFKQAQALTADAAQILQLDLAMLFHVQRLQQASKMESTTLTATVKPVLERLAQASANQSEKIMLAELFNTYGMQEEAQKMMQAAQGSPSRSRAPNAPAITNPYSRSYTYRQQQRKQVSVDDLIKKGDEAGALQEIVRQLRVAIQGCLNPQNSSNAHHQIHEVIKAFTQYKLTDQVMQTLQTAAGAGWRPRQEYAVLLEHTGLETKPAIEAHRAVITANPRAFASHARLATLLAMEGDFQTALQHWKILPDVTQALYLPALLHEFSERSNISQPRPAALAGLLSAWLRALPAGRPMAANLYQQFYQALNNIQQSDSGQNLSYPSLWVPYTKETDRNNRQWVFNEDGSLKLTAESQKDRDARRAAHDQLCQAMLQVPELALVGFGPLGGLAMFENRGLAETEKLALDLLSLRAMPKVKRRLLAQGGHPRHYGGTDPASPFGGLFATSERIAMPVPAVFATYSAALRGDQRLLDEVIFPAILKAEGKTTEAYCRAYAALLMADEAHFVSAASAWLKPAGKGSYAHRGQQQGGPLEEIVRLWKERQIQESLNPLFLAQNTETTNLQSGYVPAVVNTYVFALGQRDPEALHSFIRSLRDPWIGATPELRSQNIASWREYQQQQQRGVRMFRQQYSRTHQAVQAYIQWLQNLLQDPRALPLLQLATEDGLLDSPEWLRQVASHYTSSRFKTVDDFMQTADALGFLGEAGSFRAYVLNEGDQRATWMGRLVQHYRESWSDETINMALTQLGRRKPALGCDLAQALLMKNSRTPLQLDGKPVPVEVVQIKRPNLRGDETVAYRSAALRRVLLRHATDFATMPAAGQSELSALLRLELTGYPQPEALGEELTRVLAPLIKIENIELTRKIDQVLAAKTWTDLHQQEYQFTQQLVVLLHDFAAIDTAKAEATVRHAVELLRDSPEQKQAALQNNRETSVRRLLTALVRVPELLNTTLSLADQEGFSQSRNWTGTLRSHLEDSLRYPDNIRFVFSGTPWVAGAADYRDPKNEDSQLPTLLASLINQIENSSELRPSIHDFLAKQPATFGTELLLAFLQRAPGDDTNTRSFYNTKRPDPSFILAFIQKRREDFARLKPESAAGLLAMLQARMPDLDQKAEQDAALKQALQPLISASAAQFEADISRWMELTSLRDSGSQSYEAMQLCAPLLDRLAQADKPRAIALLDQISKLVAQQDALNNRGGGRQQPHQTQVAQWLQNAATVPELFGEILQRAEDCGAAKDSSWLGGMLSSASNLYKHRGKPRRLIALLESAGMLDPAATFNPRPLPGNSQQLTLLESISGQFTGGSTHPGLVEELAQRQPRTFGVDLITLLCSKKYNAPDEVSAFAQAHADEIAACPAGQQQLLAGYFQRRKWAEIFAEHVPALQDEFAPLLQEQNARRKTYIEDVLKASNWQDFELLYFQMQSQNTRGGGGSMSRAQMEARMRMNGGPQFFPGGQGAPSMDYLAAQLVQLAAVDAKKARLTLRHFASLYQSAFNESFDPYRRPPLDSFVMTLSASPRLLPEALRFTVPRSSPLRTPTGSSMNTFQLLDRALPASSLASAEKIVTTLNEMELLADANAYDAFPGPGLASGSLLGMVFLKLSRLNPEVAEKAAQLLTQQKDAKFGHRLFAAKLTADESPEKARRWDLCAAQFPQVKLQAAGAILQALEGGLPELSKADPPTGDLARFAPLFERRALEERNYLDAIQSSQTKMAPPFRGYSSVVRMELIRLMNGSKSGEILKLLRGMSGQLETQDASKRFATPPYYRDGYGLSYFLRSLLRVNSDDSPTLLACQMQAAARLPEVRVQADTASSQSSIQSDDAVFTLWEQRGGRARPKEVFVGLMNEVARHDIQNTSGLWIPVMHGVLERLGKLERKEISAWAAKESQAELQIICRECRLAQTLLDCTEPLSSVEGGPRRPAPASPSALKNFTSAGREAQSLLQDEKIAPHVRLALAAFFISTYPGILDAEARQAWGLAAAQAWTAGVPITRWELEILLNSAAVLPLNKTWEQTSKLVIERWNQREEIIRPTRRRYIEPAMYSAILRFALRSGDTNTLKPFISTFAHYNLPGFVGILLENGGWEHIEALKLRTTVPVSVSTRSDQANAWLPPAEAARQETPDGAREDALLAEVLALTADDEATRTLYPEARWQSRPERLAAFAHKIASLPLPQQPALRAQVLVILGIEQPQAALTLLPQYDAIARVFMSDSLGEGSADVHHWEKFIAIHAALKAAKGDLTAPDAHLDRLRTDPGIVKRYGGSTSSVGGLFRSTLFQTLSHFWQAGIARDPEKIFQFKLLSGSQQSSSAYDFLPLPTLHSGIEAWKAVLKKEPLPAGVAARLTGVSNEAHFMEFVASMAGSGKSRLSFQQRLELIVRIFNRVKLYSSPNVWALLVEHDVFTPAELAQNAGAVLKYSDLLSSACLEELAAYLRDQDEYQSASQAFAKAAEKWSTEKSSYAKNRCLLGRVEMLVRLDDMKEARQCLSEFTEGDRVVYNTARHESLIKLLSPPAPAPAK